MDDKSILFYIAGYLVHSILKGTKCVDCKQLLTADGDMPTPSVHEEAQATGLNEAKFLEQVDRGGLTLIKHT